MGLPHGADWARLISANHDDLRLLFFPPGAGISSVHAIYACSSLAMAVPNRWRPIIPESWPTYLII